MRHHVPETEHLDAAEPKPVELLAIAVAAQEEPGPSLYDPGRGFEYGLLTPRRICSRRRPANAAWARPRPAPRRACPQRACDDAIAVSRHEPLSALMFWHRELFHSNLLAWFFRTMPPQAAAVFRGWAAPSTAGERFVTRENGTWTWS